MRGELAGILACVLLPLGGAAALPVEGIAFDDTGRQASQTWAVTTSQPDSRSTALLAGTSGVVVAGSAEADRITVAGMDVQIPEYGPFLFALDAAGAPRWSRALTTGEGPRWIAQLTSDGADGFFVSGNGAVTEGRPFVPRSGGFVAQLDAFGALVRSAFLDCPAAVRAHARSPGGGVVVVGEVHGACDFGFGRRRFAIKQGGDAFVLKLGADGLPRWVQVLGGAAATMLGTAVVVDAADRVTVTGSLRGAGSGLLQHLQSDRERPFVAQFEGDGRLRWATFADVSEGRALGAVRVRDETVVVGSSCDVGGCVTGFITAIADDGRGRKTRLFGELTALIARSVTVLPDARVAVGWEAQNTLSVSVHDPVSLDPTVTWRRPHATVPSYPFDPEISSVMALAPAPGGVVLSGWSSNKLVAAGVAF